MADVVEYKNEGVWQHFLREKGGTKLCNHDKTLDTLCFLRVTCECVQDGTCTLAEDYFRRPPSRSSGSTLSLTHANVFANDLIDVDTDHVWTDIR